MPAIYAGIPAETPVTLVQLAMRQQGKEAIVKGENSRFTIDDSRAERTSESRYGSLSG